MWVSFDAYTSIWMYTGLFGCIQVFWVETGLFWCIHVFFDVYLSHFTCFIWQIQGCSCKKNLYSRKRALYSRKRALYFLNPVLSWKSSIFSQKNPVHSMNMGPFFSKWFYLTYTGPFRFSDKLVDWNIFTWLLSPKSTKSSLIYCNRCYTYHLHICICT